MYETIFYLIFISKNFLFKYSISTSFYTGEPSTTNVHVQKEKYLTDSISHDRKQQIEREHTVISQIKHSSSCRILLISSVN